MKIKNFSILFLSLIAFLGSIFCCLYMGSTIQTLNRTNRIDNFINSLAKEREGEAVFADMDITGISSDAISDVSTSFFERYNNKLSQSVFHTSISVGEDYNVSDINMMECEAVDQYYNDMYLYTNNDWRNLNSNCVFISISLDAKIKSEKKLTTSVGETIKVNVNNVEKEMKIVGVYVEKIDGYHNHFCLGKLIKECYGETIFVANSTIKQFKPSRVIAMFSYNAFNNGSKYSMLEDFAFQNNKFINHDFDEDKDVFNNWQIASSTQLSPETITVLVFSILLTISNALLVCVLISWSKDICANGSIKLKIIFESISYFCIIVIPLISTIVLKDKFWSLTSLKTPIINKSSVCSIALLSIVLLFYFAFKNRVLINKLLIHKNNSELNVYDDSNKKKTLYIGSLICNELKENNLEYFKDNNCLQEGEETIICDLSKQSDELDVILKPKCLSKVKTKEIIYSDENINYYSIASRANKFDRMFFKARIKERIFELSRKNVYEVVYVYSIDYISLLPYIKDYFPNCKLIIDVPSYEVKKTYKLKRKLLVLKEKRELCFADELICPQHIRETFFPYFSKDIIIDKIIEK